MKGEATESDDDDSLWKWLSSPYSKTTVCETHQIPNYIPLRQSFPYSHAMPDAASATVKIFDSVLHISATWCENW